MKLITIAIAWLKLKGAIESISKKIGNRELTEEQWNTIQREKEEKEIKVKEL